MEYYIESFGSHKLPETETAAKQVFSMPVHPRITEDQMDYMAKTLFDFI
jgi:dTDP-4-amino-4,6-dideoxygalactose transaminase